MCVCNRKKVAIENIFWMCRNENGRKLDKLLFNISKKKKRFYQIIINDAIYEIVLWSGLTYYIL